MEPLKRMLTLEEDEADDDSIVAILPDLRACGGQLQDKKKRKHGGSLPGKSPNVDRDHARGHVQIMADYFGSPQSFLPSSSGGAFRQDATGKWGLSSIQKVTPALRMFCYGTAADASDEYVRIAESTAMECFKKFADAVIECFGAEYLRQPTAQDIARHTRINASRGFPGMFGSLDCTHWVWKNCSVGLQGQYRDKDDQSSMILEAISTYNLWIWHAYVGMPGSNNDINVIDRSPFVVDWLHGNAPAHEYSLNGKPYKSCYLLCDGIYPCWSVFVETISDPSTDNERYFAKRQEAARKDVERCFGVLKGRFSVLSQPARSWSESTLRHVWNAAIIMHNMIVENEEDDTDVDEYFPRPPPDRTTMPFSEFVTRSLDLRDKEQHHALQQDLIEHLWARRKQKEREGLFT